MIYVFIQFFCLLVLLMRSDFTNINVVFISLILIALIIGIIAIKTIKINNLNILPELKKDHKLIITGIYKYIHHPMYLSLLLIGFALLLTNFNYLSIIFWIILIINLYLKSQKEEFYLQEKFNNYANYKQKVGRFFPYKFY